MDDRRRIRLVRGATLVVALAVLGVILVRIMRASPMVSSTNTLSTPVPTQPVSTLTPGKLTRPPAERETPLPALNTDLLDLSPSAPSSPANQWARQLLDQIVLSTDEIISVEDGFAWWQNSGRQGLLELQDDTLTLNNNVLPVSDLSKLDIYTPDTIASSQLKRHASIAWSGEALRLTLLANEPGGTDSNWLLSTGSIELSLVTLVQQAAMRNHVLIAAYTDLPESAGQLVLIQALSPSELITPTATASLTPTIGPTPTATITPPPTATATTTEKPSIYLNRTVAELIDPIINALDHVDQEVVTAYLSEYPVSGVLSWSGGGATVGGNPIPLEQADEVNYYRLRSAEEGGGTERFLRVVFDEGFTRLVEAQESVWGHRMEEILYWMDQWAAARGGQLYVTYEDFGSTQSVTVTDFQPFGSESP